MVASAYAATRSELARRIGLSEICGDCPRGRSQEVDEGIGQRIIPSPVNEGQGSVLITQPNLMASRCQLPCVGRH